MRAELSGAVARPTTTLTRPPPHCARENIANPG